MPDFELGMGLLTHGSHDRVEGAAFFGRSLEIPYNDILPGFEFFISFCSWLRFSFYSLENTTRRSWWTDITISNVELRGCHAVLPSGEQLDSLTGE